MDTFWQDLRYGLRMLAKNPGFTAVAVITLALGIGVNTTIFSVVNGVLLRPLDYPQPERVVAVFQIAPSSGFPRFGISEGQYETFRDQATTFEQVSAFHTLQVVLTGVDEPERITIAHASVSTLATLGFRPALGRDFLSEEGQTGRNQVVLLSHGFWQRRFGGDTNVLGRVIKLNGNNFTVIGVLPAVANLPTDLLDIEKAQLWMPEIFDPQNPNRWGSNYLNSIGRLKDGTRVEQAQAEIATIARQIQQARPEADIKDPNYAIRVVPLQEDLVGNVKRALLVLAGAVGFVLLIACANVANLLLARGASRQKEVAVRAALGASRKRLIAQLLTESGLLAVFGGALGCLLAWWGLDVLASTLPGQVPRFEGIALDTSALLFTAGISMLASMIFGLVPALQVSRLDLSRSLHEEGRSATPGRARSRVQRALVAAEVGLAVVLVFGAGLLAQSLYNLLSVDPGFRPGNLLTVQMALPGTKYAENQQTLNFYNELLTRTRALPGVESAALVNVPPLAGFGGDTVFDVEGRPLAQEQMKSGTGFAQHLGFRMVSPGYFETLGVRLIRGRTFTEFDRPDGNNVTIINETMARRFWPNEDPIGRRVRLYRNPTETGPWMEIVGVVADTRIRSLTEDAKQEIFIPYAQFTLRSTTLVLRTSGEPMAIVASVREQVRALDADLPLFNIRTMEQVLGRTIAQPRLNLALLGTFAGLALLLAMVGVYGMLAYNVSLRMHEIGVRMALGAQPRDVLGMVLRDGLKMATVGLFVGLAGALALSRVLSALLYGVSANDPRTFVGVSALVFVVAAVACWIPARRATRVDPMVALRYE
jgi:putative ABC transport system permease protein